MIIKKKEFDCRRKKLKNAGMIRIRVVSFPNTVYYTNNILHTYIIYPETNKVELHLRKLFNIFIVTVTKETFKNYMIL